jgi:outer membrane lipoprotein-sorting protein
MFRRFTFVLAALALIAPLASAQTLDEVLAKHFAAQGGLDKLKAMKSVRMTGTMSMGPGMEAPIVLEKSRPNKMRMEFVFQGLTGIQAYDGKNGWMVMPFMGKKDPEAMPAEAMKEMEDQADFDGPLIDWKAKGHTVELIGKEDMEGTPTFKLKVAHKNGNIDYTYIDAETYLVIKQEGKRTMRGTEVESESSIGDYKQVDGFTFPFAMEQGAKGAPQRQKMTFSKIEVNPAVEDARFAMPAVAAKPDSAKSDTTKAAAKPAAKPAVEKAAKKGTGKN